ncbi:tripartite tricarboxylate transporter permease [Ahrensia kielensis]|uniref:Tripartite tricarboxylate transporter permease n=1 Tax=Ahrensia kielensis TaxID=76980 RepID=A0ABU9T2S1_9HYPH
MLFEILQPNIIIAIFAASFLGIFIGAIPGLTATMGAALLVPFTVYLDPLPGMAAIISMAASSIFAGDIPGTLLHVPGTPASAAYADDAHAMAKRGQAKRALLILLFASVVGGMLSTVSLIFGASYLSRIAMSFTSVEYFWMACLGLSCAVVIASEKPLKGTAALLIGLAIASVGFDPTNGYPRFTMGMNELSGGVMFIPALIGLFAVSQIFKSPLKGENVGMTQRETVDNTSMLVEAAQVIATLCRYPIKLLRGGSLGIVIGALPGAGADIAAWISYSISKRFSKTPQEYGKGHEPALIEASASNNGALGSAWIPALVLGIPGDTITAIAIGVLIMKGIQPGPMIFFEQANLVNGIFIIFFISNLVLIPVGMIIISMAHRVLSIKRTVLNGFILLFCIVGAYATSGSVTGIWIMLAMGLLGRYLESRDVPLAPLILALVLGTMIESHMMRALITSRGDVDVFFSRPLGLFIAMLVFASLLWPVVMMLIRKVRQKPNTGREC